MIPRADVLVVVEWSDEHRDEHLVLVGFLPGPTNFVILFEVAVLCENNDKRKDDFGDLDDTASLNDVFK